MSHFVIARTDAGWLGRFIASNGREVWRTSEVYTRKRAAERAVELIVGDSIHVSPFAEYPEVNWQGSPNLEPTEVRYIDARSAD